MKQILVFILFSILLCWLMFSPIYKHVLVMRQAVLQQEVDYLLEIGTNGSHGYIDERMVEQSRLRMEQYGFDADQLQYQITSTTGQSADSSSDPIIRGEGIKLVITYPYDDLFVIDRLLGIPVPEKEDRMSAGGMQMSEYVP